MSSEYPAAVSLQKDEHRDLPKRHPQHPSHREHERYWTKATGVWHCRTCGQFYRVLGDRHAE